MYGTHIQVKLGLGLASEIGVAVVTIDNVLYLVLYVQNVQYSLCVLDVAWIRTHAPLERSKNTNGKICICQCTNACFTAVYILQKLAKGIIGLDHLL